MFVILKDTTNYLKDVAKVIGSIGSKLLGDAVIH